MPNFPDPPGRRLAYDADGSVCTHYNTANGAISELTTGQKQILNNESVDSFNMGSTGTVNHTSIYFPGLRDITDLFVSLNSNDSNIGTYQGIDYSVDSTNPLDGTWVNIAFSPLFTWGGLVIPNYRNGFGAYVASGVKALRLRASTSGANGAYYPIFAWHVYGTRAAGDTSRQVALVDSAGNRFNKDFDFQDRPRGSTYKWKAGTLYNQLSELYVKNFSATETANTVVVGQEALSGNMHNNIRISLDDITYTQTLTATTIAPGASYGPIFVRWTPPAGDTLGLQTMRIPVTVGSWT